MRTLQRTRNTRTHYDTHANRCMPMPVLHVRILPAPTFPPMSPIPLPLEPLRSLRRSGNVSAATVNLMFSGVDDPTNHVTNFTVIMFNLYNDTTQKIFEGTPYVPCVRQMRHLSRGRQRPACHHQLRSKILYNEVSFIVLPISMHPKFSYEASYCEARVVSSKRQTFLAASTASSFAAPLYVGIEHLQMRLPKCVRD